MTSPSITAYMEMSRSEVACCHLNYERRSPCSREGNRTLWRAFFTAFPDVEVTMEDLVVAGDRVVGRFIYRGTHDGPLWGIPATGNRIEMRSIDIWRTENGSSSSTGTSSTFLTSSSRSA